MSDVNKFTKNEYKVIAIEGNTYVVRNEKGITHRRKEYELMKVDSDATESETFEPKGEGKEFKEKEKKQRAQHH